MPKPNDVERLLTSHEAARILGVSQAWLERKRYERAGPPFVRVGGPNGRAVRYRQSDIAQWVNDNLVVPERPAP